MYNKIFILFLNNLIHIHNFAHLTSIISMQYFRLFIDLNAIHIKYNAAYRNINKLRICFVLYIYFVYVFRY